MSTHDLESRFERFRTHGDLGALSEVFDELAPELLPLALHLTGRRHDAEDLVQQTLLAALEGASSWDSSRPLRPWLVGILAHQARRQRRTNARVVEPERLALPRAEDPPARAAESELVAAVEEALVELPPKYSEIVSLHLFEGLAPREMAERLGIDAALVRTHLSRGLERLRRSLPASSGAWSAVELAPLLERLRTRVLGRAREIAAPAGTAIALKFALGLAASLCAVAAITAGGLSLAGDAEPRAAALASLAPEANATGMAAPDAAPALEAPSSSARTSVAAPASAREPQGSTTRLHGRITLPDGAPAGGVTVTLEGWEANRKLVELYGAPKDWKNPAPARTDEHGEFEFRVDPPRAFQWIVRAKREGCADVGWRWSEWLRGEERDLGHASFEPECVIVGTLRRADGKPIGAGWWVEADPKPRSGQRDALENLGNSKVDATTGSFRIGGLIAGPASVAARHELGIGGGETQVLLVPGAPVPVELRYAGADPSHNVLLRFQDDWHIWNAAEGLKAELVDRQGQHLQPQAGGPGPLSKLSFVDVPDAEWRLEIRSPNYAPFVQEGVRPGTSVRVHLQGNAGLALKVLDPDGKPVEHYDLDVTLDERGNPRTQRMATAAEVSPALRLLEHIPAGFPLRIEVNAAGLGSARAEFAPLAPEENRALEIAFARTRTLDLRALADDGKTPIPGVEIELTRGEFAGHAFGPTSTVSSGGQRIPPRDLSARTGADGSARFPGLNDGRWTARVHWSAWLLSDLPVQIGPDAAARLDLREPAHGFLRGRILVGDGEAPQDQRFQLSTPDAPRTYRLEDQRVPADTIGADGSFRWGPLPVGSLRVNLMRGAEVDGGQAWGFLDVTTLSIEAGKELEATLDLRKQCAAHVSVAVRVGGKPLPRAYVQALPLDDVVFGASEFADADAQGIARLTLAPQVRKLIGVRGKDWVWASPEPVEPGLCETLERIVDVALVQGSLRLLDEGTHEPLRNTDVSWSMVVRGKSDQSGQPGMVLMQSIALGTTGPAGELELALPPGELLVWRRSPGDALAHGDLRAVQASVVWTDKGPAVETLALPAR